jgi:hypothetical protein
MNATQTRREKMDIRERIAELTVGAKTQLDIDALVTRGVLKTLLQEYPGDAAEIRYEWENRKMECCRKMTEYDD